MFGVTNKYETQSNHEDLKDIKPARSLQRKENELMTPRSCSIVFSFTPLKKRVEPHYGIKTLFFYVIIHAKISSGGKFVLCA